MGVTFPLHTNLKDKLLRYFIMAIILNKLFVILRFVSNRTLVVWPCLFLIVLVLRMLQQKIWTGKYARVKSKAMKDEWDLSK